MIWFNPPNKHAITGQLFHLELIENLSEENMDFRNSIFPQKKA